MIFVVHWIANVPSLALGMTHQRSFDEDRDYSGTSCSVKRPQSGHCVKNQHLTIAFMHDNCRGRGQCDFKTHVIQATV